MALYTGSTAVRRLALAALVLGACSNSLGPGPQEASFPPGERVAHSGGLAVELSGARYDLQTVALNVTLTNAGDTPIDVESQGILLAYNALEFPVTSSTTNPFPEHTMVEAGGTVELELKFAIEQPLVEAGTLHVLSLKHDGDHWLEPVRLAVPPPAAFVEAAVPQPE